MPKDWLDLSAPPALPGLFLRAAVRRGLRGRSLPTRGVRAPVMVDARNLERYRQVCGFRNDHLLPPTYPHILAFGLQMGLLTDARFPFPLLGLVHLENRISVLRPLGGLGPFQASVRVADLQPHDKGVTFSLITQLHDQLGLLWEGDSRLLFRGMRLEGTPPEREEQPELPLEQIDHWQCPADIGRRYARVAGDYNPIHLSAASARLFGFPRAIAHGLWNKARSLAALGERLPAAGYQVQVRFQKPVLLPSSVSLLASEVAPAGQFALRGEDGLPHMAGAWKPLDA
ncbi:MULTISPECIES: MaoC/PaaZ C-terminal domain-containing protein [unclassified Pseudomonas]|jgi:acyl dehydratase|uniref:MaoC family dehydratase n=1 Tax=unclassified Pseudomonas TaxID=196821 RepID=UPI00073197A9|nr:MULTISPECIES: MaoC/PaaZ C-terminal domain-containing protein [unclassified Pseudomonas]KSW25705.1 acyl dehydratase [Pseudomonas sp. ADP]OBP12287.1 acyl dehydratase [Pseudomonas sp. EGD-AKN5]QOF82300.1 acyl dehydratase [Pseudomonas sp. ADPe]